MPRERLLLRHQQILPAVHYIRPLVDEVVANLELPEQYGGYDLQRARAHVETVCRRAPLEELFKLNEIAGVIHTCLQVARWSRHHPQDIGVG